MAKKNLDRLRMEARNAAFEVAEAKYKEAVRPINEKHNALLDKKVAPLYAKIDRIVAKLAERYEKDVAPHKRARIAALDEAIKKSGEKS